MILLASIALLGAPVARITSMLADARAAYARRLRRREAA
jgi:hypothetical protein